jgi:hypothetical protein
MLNKIENFLFDILGLFVPGLIFWILLIALPSLVIDFYQISSQDYSLKFLLILKNFIFENINHLQAPSSFYFTVGIVVVSYLSGNTIKILAKYIYDFLALIFDEGLNQLLRRCFEIPLNFISLILVKKIKSFSNIVNYFKKLARFITNLLKDIIIFKPSDISSDNYSIKEEVIKRITTKYVIDFPNNLHSIYKLSNIVMLQEGLTSLVPQFLAKYNFYRSLSFIFLFNILYVLIFYSSFANQISPLGKKLQGILIGVHFLMWLTFHIKYKRYWTLCGNESLMSLFYFLVKNEQSSSKSQ